MILPLPFGRGEGRGEGSRCVVYPTDPSISPLQSPRSIRLRFSIKVRYKSRSEAASSRIRLQGRCQSIIMSSVKSRLVLSGMLRRKALAQVKQVGSVGGLDQKSRQGIECVICEPEQTSRL
jgi:hypothetical protein